MPKYQQIAELTRVNKLARVMVEAMDRAAPIEVYEDSLTDSDKNYLKMITNIGNNPECMKQESDEYNRAKYENLTKRILRVNAALDLAYTKFKNQP
ncbi:hypothetical protein HDU81_001772 [Chytriomyces hyalinus]|nr:hypothetical protein HDU81_001772 [Chytriomyces hyalinus]